MESIVGRERLSTGKKVVAGAAIGVAVPAAVGVARKLRSAGRSRSSASGRSSSSRTTGRTKEELYNQAKRLNIEGRSKMTKAQLERAISRKRS